jgi:uncharacterized membrane protein
MKQAIALSTAGVLLAAGCASGSSAASKAYSVCNNVNAAIHVAVAYHVADSDGWTSKGWTDVAPGACTQVVDPTAAGKTFYAYAYISRDKTTNTRDWGGYEYFCLAWDPTFTNARAKENANCTRSETQDQDWVGFFEVDTADGQPTTIGY